MRKTYIVVISIIVLLSIITFSTYAMFTQDINIGEFVNLTASTLPTESNITEYERITIPASESRTIDLNITNSTSNSLYYGVWYEMVDPSTINSNINIGKLTGSTNATIGQLASNGNITVQICIVNNSTDDIIINVGVGYSNTNSLNLPTGRSIITGEAQPEYIASDYIISLSQGDTYTEGNGNGVYQTNNHEYRYVGGEVNNYVKFNDDLYRIIGVFDDNSHGVTGEYLVKLIAARKLTAAAWGAYNSSPAYTTYSSHNNDWTGTTTGVPASANILLNEFFLNPTATSTYGECIDWTYGTYGNTSKSKNCTDIKGYGIESTELRNYIQPVTWYLYGYTDEGLSKQNFYQCERNNYSGCTSANSGTYSGTTTASIGLMYVSDYMYASGYVASNNTSTSGGSSNFMNLNWLYKGEEWTITPRVDSAGFAFSVGYSGYVYGYGTDEGYGLRPTFYLKSTIKIKSGDGTFKNPYTIG